MHEIRVQTLRAQRNSVEHRMRPSGIERVPPHMRDLQISVRWHNPLDVARDPAQSLRHLVFAAALGHELHTDANAEEGTAALAHALVERLHHAVEGIEPPPAIGEGADTRQHHAIGASDLLGVARHHDRLSQSFLARGALECFRRGMQIAGPVVDNRDAHRGAPGWGKRPTTSGAARRETGTPAGDDVRGSALPKDLSIQALPTHASKNRRSADSRSSATTMPTFLQPRRDSVKRRNVVASKPTRSDRSALAMVVTAADAPIKCNPTRSATATRT